MKKQPVFSNQLHLTFIEAEYLPNEILPPPDSQSTVRRITVRPKWEVNPNGHIYPEIRFSGKYLEEANFLIGRPVIVMVRKNAVMLSIRKPDRAVSPDVADWLEQIKTRRLTAAAQKHSDA